MRCPHCGNTVSLPANTRINMESYGRSCHTVTECCGKIVRAIPIFTYRVEMPYKVENIREDDWGREPAKS